MSVVRPDDVNSLFAKAFGGAPSVVASAPGRVNIIGEHTDYNGGDVLPIAITNRACVAVRARAGGARSIVVSGQFAKPGEWTTANATRTGQWWDYVSGVARAFVDRGIALPDIDVAVSSDVPVGAGLSSSAAVEVATATALGALTSDHLSPRDAALLSHSVESEFVGVQCGIMDQFASSLSLAKHALHLRCDTAEYAHVPFTESVLVFDSATPRALRQSDYNLRRDESDEALRLLQRAIPSLRSLAEATPDQVRAVRLPPPLDKRALHVSEETQRVRQVVASLNAGEGVPDDLLFASHESLRTLYECSTPELDWFVGRASSVAGIRGARLTGAGWGGCAIAVGTDDALRELSESVVQDYRQTFGLGARTWITSASPGACLENPNR